jgi:hypothetical protein
MDESINQQLLAQIHADFAPYTETGIESQHINRIRAYLRNGDLVLSLPSCSHIFSILHVAIIDNRVQCINLQDLQQMQYQDYTRYYRGICLIRMLEQAAHYFCLPDLDVYISVEDHFIIDELPLLVMAKPKHSKTILCPPYTFEGFDDFKNLSWESFQTTILQRNINWRDREEVFFFRGSNSHWSRQLVVQQNNPIFDVALLSSQHDPNSKEFVPLQLHSQYRYLLDLPGWMPYTFRYNHLLMTGSLVHKVETWEPYQLFFSNCVEPWKHYIPISVYDLPIEQKPTALLEAIYQQWQWNQNFDDLCQQIAYQGQLRMTEITMQTVYWYWQELLWSYVYAQKWANRSQKVAGVNLGFLLSLQLRKYNFLICPNLEQSLEELYGSFVELFSHIMQKPFADRFTLLVQVSNDNLQLVQECLAEAALSVLWQSPLLLQEPQITFLRDIMPIQWQSLQPFLDGLIVFSSDKEDDNRSNLPINIPKVFCEHFANFR